MDTGNEILETYIEWLNGKECEEYRQALENKYNKYDVWVSADVKYMRTFTKTFAIASYRKNNFDFDMLPEQNEETVRYEY